MKNNIPKYFVYAYLTDEDSFENAWEYTDYCYSERNMVACVKRALKNGYTVKVKNKQQGD